MVLRGTVRFYGAEDEVLGEFGKREGIVIPRNTKYWFESCGKEDLELLQVAAFDRDVKSERIDVNARKLVVDTTQRFDGRIRNSPIQSAFLKVEVLPRLLNYYACQMSSRVSGFQPGPANIGFRSPS